ncbi:MAG TPA: hypothetical protein VG900_03320 [Hyphomicrobiaceae bacterium]|nr:hypothetical protein [Hyphomicrobiaceae bacterium]
MHRLFALLALGAAALGVWLLVGGAEPISQGGLLAAAEAGSSNSYASWAIGLLMGLALAWLSSFDWSEFPEWLRLQRRRAAWLMLGAAFASILLLF